MTLLSCNEYLSRYKVFLYQIILVSNNTFRMDCIYEHCVCLDFSFEALISY